MGVEALAKCYNIAHRCAPLWCVSGHRAQCHSTRQRATLPHFWRRYCKSDHIWFLEEAQMTDGAATGVTGRLPLTGFRVLELSHIVAWPSGGLLLADLGADVIKVEEPRGGDQSRAMPNRGSTFYALNRNKRSLAVDLKSEAGREIFTRLVRGADILLDNYAPGVLERLGFGYEWGSSINP